MRQLNERARSVFNSKKCRVLVTITAILIIAMTLYPVAFATTASQASSTQNDTSNRFLLELTSSTGNISAYFSESGGFGESRDVVYRIEGNREVRIEKKIPGNPKVGDLVLIREASRNTDFFKWLGDIESLHRNGTHTKSGTLTMFDKDGQMVSRWSITNAWPFSVKVEQDKNDSDKYNEVVTFAIENLEWLN